MAEEKPVQLKRYRVQLEGNRGETVMKLREEDLERYNVIGPADGEEEAAAEEEQPQKEEQQKSRRASNKSRSAENK